METYDNRMEISGNSSEGWTTGYSTGPDDEIAFFGDGFEPVALLQGNQNVRIDDDALKGMEKEHGNNAATAVQPFEMVRRAKRQAQQLAETSDPEEDVQQKFSQGFDAFANRKKKKRSARKSEKKEHEGTIKRLEGEAILLFAANRIEEGEKICHEVMRLAPNSADVYQTLGSMIEQTGQLRKALDYYMIAAHLAPRKTEFWKQLSHSSSELGFHRQAIYCLTRVLRVDPNDLDTHIDRALLYAELGENRRACEAFEKINGMRPGDFEVVKMLGKLYHRMGNPHKAIEILEHSILLYEDKIDFTVINILTDLYLQQGSYSEASGLISRAEGVLCYGQALPIDLKVKLGICNLHMGDVDTAYSQFDDLLKEPIEECMDLYLQAGDALVEVNEHQQALHLFERLTETTENQPGLWKRIVRCKEQCEGRSAVVSWWLQLVDGLEWTHESYVEAALAAIKGLADLGDLDVASERLNQLTELLDMEQVVFPQEEKAATSALLLKESLELRIGRKENSFEEMLSIVYHTLRQMQQQAGMEENDIDIPISKDLSCLMQRIRVADANEKLEEMDAGRERRSVFTGFRSARQEQRFARKEKSLSDCESGSSQLPGIFLISDFVKGGEQYNIFMKVIDGLLSNERWTDAEYFLTTAIAVSSRLAKTSEQRMVRDAFRVKLIEVLHHQEKHSEALEIVKKLVSNWPYSIKIWNAYCMLLGEIGSSKWLSRFITSYRQKYPGSVPVTLIMGQLLMLTGQPDMAIGEYREALKMLPNHPVLWLCIGVAKLTEASREETGGNRNLAIARAFTCLQEYASNRNHPQEVYYNFGRACHHVGLVAIAVEYYNKALAVEEEHPEYSLKREIAHNLVQIYKNSGSIELARDIMRRYLTI